jgi:hypothetical protein
MLYERSSLKLAGDYYLWMIFSKYAPLLIKSIFVILIKRARIKFESALQKLGFRSDKASQDC